MLASRFGFAGTRNPRTCMPHEHHVYWRLDLDIEGAVNDVVQQRGLILPGEASVDGDRAGDLPQARARAELAGPGQKTERGYRIIPGAADGTADAYGVADLWFLRYRDTELEDGVTIVGGSPNQTQTHLDQFVNGESIDGMDVVVWYAGHFRHDEHAPAPYQGHIVGPELRPVRW